jgi:dTDP-4-dehydrorhamnose reductase
MSVIADQCEPFMETNTNVPNDVLHSANHSKLSDEEIAKAVARHNRHRHEVKPIVASAKRPAGGKK